MTKTIQKQERIDLRVAPSQKDFLVYVAESTNMTLSAFIIESAYSKAQEIAANKTRFELSTEQWKQFFTALDSSPREIPQLKKLFQEPDIFSA